VERIWRGAAIVGDRRRIFARALRLVPALSKCRIPLSAADCRGEELLCGTLSWKLLCGADDRFCRSAECLRLTSFGRPRKNDGLPPLLNKDYILTTFVTTEIAMSPVTPATSFTVSLQPARPLALVGRISAAVPWRAIRVILFYHRDACAVLLRRLLRNAATAENGGRVVHGRLAARSGAPAGGRR